MPNGPVNTGAPRGGAKAGTKPDGRVSHEERRSDSAGPESKRPARQVNANDVAAYLRRHPDFFARHPEILDGMAPPGRSEGGLVDFQQAMIARLREENASLAGARDELVTTGRANMTVQSRTHQAVLAFLGARSFEELIERATNDLTVLLDIDVVTLGVERADVSLPRPRLGGICQLEPGTVDAVIGVGQRVLLRDSIEGDPLLFGAGAGLVASDALVRLKISRHTPPALLALGARQPDFFHPRQGSELLVFLGAALESCIRGWLNLEE